MASWPKDGDYDEDGEAVDQHTAQFVGALTLAHRIITAEVVTKEVSKYSRPLFSRRLSHSYGMVEGLFWTSYESVLETMQNYVETTETRS
jgi:hypothetical protein